MIGPAACGVLAGCVPAVGVVLPAADPEDVAAAEQALTPSRATTAMVSAAAAPRGERAPRRDIDMPPSCLAQPDASPGQARSR